MSRSVEDAHEDPYLSGYGEGWAEACGECRDPLNDDGSCDTCGTVACLGCGAVVLACDASTLETGPRGTIRICAGCREGA